MDTKIMTKFTEEFAEQRRKSGLSYRALEGVSGIKYSALAAMQTGHRPVGEQSARRLASAFGLMGEASESFVLSALNTSKERVLEAVKEYPAEALNCLGLVLCRYGIMAGQITACEVVQGGAESSLRFTVTGGRSLRLDVHLVPGA